MRRCLLVIFLFFIFEHELLAQVCETIGQNCVEGPQTRIFNGHPIAKECWKYQLIKRCYDDNYSDNCKTIKSFPGCEQLGSKCVDNMEDGSCKNYQNTYECGSLFDVNSNKQITFLESSYTVSQDGLDNSECDSAYPAANNNCQKVSSQCVEGPQTRKINGYDVYKECWKYQENYSCKTGKYINNCKNIPDNCAFVNSQCLVDIDNICNHRQNLYSCSKSTINTTNIMQCGKTNYCVNGQCSQPEDDSSKNDFAKSIAYLSSVNQAAKDNDGNSDLRIFSGSSKSCEKDSVNYNNCCKDDGFGQDYAGASCSAEEKSLMEMQSKKLCHYVGSYCSEKIPLIGKCLKTSKAYCCFNSKISRVITEQGRAQLGKGWGSAESPDCGGFTPDELSRMKFDKMDLSEISSDIAGSVVIPDKTYLEDKVKKTMEGYGQPSN